ncbi:hypothetical protein ACHAP7_012082 [Fusarium lateritium]
MEMTVETPSPSGLPLLGNITSIDPKIPLGFYGVARRTVCECKGATTLPRIVYREGDRKHQHDIEVMRDTAREVLDARKADGSTRKDLLIVMLEGVDKRRARR